MKISARAYDFDHGAVLDILDCILCEGTLVWELSEEYDIPCWVSECCERTYTANIKSIRVTING